MFNIENIKNTILFGESSEVLKQIPDKSIDAIITSPPYWALRDYGVDGQLGLESNFNEYIEKLINIFSECKRILKDDGTCWVNLGDTYSGSGAGQKDFGKSIFNTEHYKKTPTKTYLQDKSLCNIPARFSIAMQDENWILRNKIIWHKPSCMPSSVKDRFTVDYEEIFFFAKNRKYKFNQQFENVSEATLNDKRPHGVLRQKIYNGKYVKAGMVKKIEVLPENDFRELRNMRTVWSVNTKGIKENHFAAFPEELVTRMILASSNENDIILDPFMGAGTSAMACRKQNRNFIGIEINSEYIEIANKRLEKNLGMFN